MYKSNTTFHRSQNAAPSTQANTRLNNNPTNTGKMRTSTSNRTGRMSSSGNSAQKQNEKLKPKVIFHSADYIQITMYLL